jgi:hypothetical protein
MSDSRRLGSALGSDAEARDSQVEALLVDGLDRYFAGQHEEAIHLWTRVLFLDRSHVRARAYIDRARTALAERQRRADEMLHATGESLAQGDAERARLFLTEAEANFGDDERAAGLRWRLERLERLHADVGALESRSGETHEPRPRARRSRHRVYVGAAAAAVMIVALGAMASRGFRELMGWSGAPPAPRAGASALQPPALSTSEIAYIRARTLVSRGRLAEALLALDRVAPESEEATAADALRLRVQQQLLAAGGGPYAGTSPQEGTAPR